MEGPNPTKAEPPESPAAPASKGGGGDRGAEARTGGRARRLLAAVVCLALGLVGAAGVSHERSWGWDESMHAELPAARMLLALEGGDTGRFAEALHDCQQYPFVYPLVLAAAQAPGGLSEATCRRAARLLWGVGLFALFLLAEAMVERRGSSAGPTKRWLGASAPWLAVAFGALSPLFVHFSGTLFLEVPFAVASLFALRAWVRRGASDVGARASAFRELAAGAWVTVAFFTKFNYGLLLAAGLGLDLLIEGGLAFRRGAFASWARRAAWLALVPALALAWWFLLPLPFGAERAAQHRDAFAGFLGGNRQLQRIPWTLRGIDWANGVAATPRMLALLLVGLVVSGFFAARSGVRAVWLVLLVSAVAIGVHPFHLDRFLVPVAAPLFALAAVGWSWLVPRTGPVPALALAAVFALALVAPKLDSEAFADRFGPELQPEVIDYRNAVMAEKRDLRPGRRLETGGLSRADSDELLDLVCKAIAPGERPLWLGGNSELSPAALHVELYRRQGDRERFLAYAHQPMVLTVEGVDPGWSNERFFAFAAEFDVVIATDPPDIGGRPDRWAFIDRYRRALFDRPDWTSRILGTVQVDRRDRPAEARSVYVGRPVRPPAGADHGGGDGR